MSDPKLKKYSTLPLNTNLKTKPKKDSLWSSHVSFKYPFILVQKSYDDVKEHKMQSKIKSYLNENRSMTLDTKELCLYKNKALVGK